MEIIGEAVENPEWSVFQAALLEKVATQLSADVSSTASRAAIDIAYTIARTGGEAGCTAVLNRLTPVLLESAREAHTSVRKELLQAVKQASSGSNGATTIMPTARSISSSSASSGSEEERLSVGCEMLAQLISCVGVSTHHATQVSCRSHTHSQQSSSSLLATTCSVNVLKPFIAEIFHVLAAFVSTYALNTQEESTEHVTNPFAAVKASFSTPAASSIHSTEPVKGEGDGNARKFVAHILPPVHTVLALVGSISAMCELLQRFALSCAIISYVIFVLVTVTFIVKLDFFV